MSRLRYFFDTEFMEDGRTIELLSIGVVCEDGREFYAENGEADWGNSNEWVRANVIPHLHVVGDPLQKPLPQHDLLHREVMPRRQIGERLLQFVGAGDAVPDWWAYYGDYDWVVLCQLYGRMVDLPKGWPMFAQDIKQLAVSVGNPDLSTIPKGTEHNALDDARWNRAAYDYLLTNTWPVPVGAR